uniref:Uncharacterized protein n=1 Tax=Monopterus albus TaxID=43700 RepID=A0A3Q3JPI3_MONAL
MSPPRLTSALRSFSNVSKKEDLTEQLYDLKIKRLKRRELFAREGLTWQKIVHFCTEHQDKDEHQAAKQEMKNLLLAARQIAEVNNCLGPFDEGKQSNKLLKKSSLCWPLQSINLRGLNNFACPIFQFFIC